jgi:tRNA-modifying protein YgfZ
VISSNTLSLDGEEAVERLGHRIRPSGILDVAGPDRESFLQGQLTQDVRGMKPGEMRPTAGLTPRGKLLFFARLQSLTDRLRLYLPAVSREPILAHLAKYAVFQKVSIADRSAELIRMGLYGPVDPNRSSPSAEVLLLAGEGELSAELVMPAGQRELVERWLQDAGSVPVSEDAAEARRVEAGRPRFGQDADESYLADEVGLDAAVSATKGCYVGQEIVARMRTYGRVNRRLVGFRFAGGPVPRGALLRRQGEIEPGKTEAGRVTSSVFSPRWGPIGLGYAFHDVPVGGRLVFAEDPSRSALVCGLPFA